MAMQPQRGPDAVDGSHRSIGWILAAGVGVFAAVAAVKRIRRMEAVAPDLRSPMLLAPITMNRLTRAFANRVARRVPVVTPADVRVTTHRIHDAGYGAAVGLLTFDRGRTEKARPVLLWMHGGGYVIGTPEQDLAFIARLLSRIDVVVASVDYRLAPEHHFPDPLDDCRAALDWIMRNADDLGVDPAQVIIGGQSAGGGLAAALAQSTADLGPVQPLLQLLVYPMLDAETVVREGDGSTGHFVWTPRSNRFGWRSYLGFDPASGSYPAYAVPAARADLAGLPPAWIGVGSLDLFLAEDAAYADRLRRAGVPCELHVVEGAYHGFDVLMPDAATSLGFHESMFRAMERVLGRRHDRP